MDGGWGALGGRICVCVGGGGGGGVSEFWQIIQI